MEVKRHIQIAWWRWAFMVVASLVPGAPQFAAGSPFLAVGFSIASASLGLMALKVAPGAPSIAIVVYSAVWAASIVHGFWMLRRSATTTA